MTDRHRHEGLAEIDGHELYVIPDIDRLPPFLMSVVSDGDRWMFVSSTGALTAGRVDANAALFPYETDDRLHAAAGRVGPVTRIRARTADGPVLWRPMAGEPGEGVSRLLARSVVGDAVVFEERHDGLEMTFRYRWCSADEHGLIRSSTLRNDGADPVVVDVLDGVVGVLPHGLDPPTYERLSNLSNAYRRSELLDPDVALAVFSLESPVSDHAEPEEVLRATAVWSCGLDGAEVLLDTSAIRAFEHGRDEPGPAIITGRPGAYLLRRSVELAPGDELTWHLVADVALDQFAVVELRSVLRSGALGATELDSAVAAGRQRLQALMASSDSAQRTAEPVTTAHHLANVTYNVMRGGVPVAGHSIDTADFGVFLGQRNRVVHDRHAAWLDALPARLELGELQRRIGTVGDEHLARLGREYLPFSFSRRHGDPSRPWNRFSIRVNDDEGEPLVRYEGNWRDVFQNWEALCHAFPAYLPGVVSTFVNASTVDGYNPYRIMREGVDWEVPDPDDPWANIGYWGDHQIIYLLRLLEATDRFHPGAIAELLPVRSFTYTDVPYRIADFDELVRDPKATITFDDDGHEQSTARAEELGGDGRLVLGPDGDPLLVTLLEKLLVTTLAKLSNFVPGGGIWMNTQRPEWNDANNSLVGYGLSMVTLFHLRRFLVHLRATVSRSPLDVDVSSEVAVWLDAVHAALAETPVDGPDPEVHRWQLVERLGRAASDHRNELYRNGFSGATTAVSAAAVTELCEVALRHLDATIERNERADGLAHAYNLIDLAPEAGRASVTHLPVMLEGQVAALGSGVLDPAGEVRLLEALFSSDLYRADQRTFLLAPVRTLPSFVGKSIIAADDAAADPLLAALLDAGEPSVVGRDVDGRVRFRPELINAAALDAALDRLAADDEWTELVERHRSATLERYEGVYEHHAFLGRSAAMYAYEGIGSIYWHMVGKLLLAVHDAATTAADRGASDDVVAHLVEGYERVRAGLGFNKTAAEFGAVPTEPYSHTPMHEGAQQPGMTGAVKEELLSRPRELGVAVHAGELVFDPLLLRRSELLDREERWTVATEHGGPITIDLPPGSVGLTFCQVPIVVALGDGEPVIEIELTDGSVESLPGTGLGRDLSAKLFGRTGEIRTIRATLPADG